MKSPHHLNGFLLASKAAVALDPATAWRAVAGAQVGATFVSEPRPQRYSRLPGREWVGDSAPAQHIPVYPNPAISVDLATASGSWQIRYPELPSRTIPAPVP